MGSIQKRGENTYYLTVSAGFGLNGKRQRYTKTVQAKNDKEAKKLLDKFQVEVESNSYIHPEKLTFEKFANDWLEKYAKSNLAPKTFQRYKEILDLRIIKAFKNFRLEQIKPIHLLDFYKNLQEDGIRLDARYIAKEDLKKVLSSKNIDTKKLILLCKISERTIDKVLKGLPTSLKTAKVISSKLEIGIDSIFEMYGESGSLSERTIKHHHRLLSTMFQHAVEWQLISDNPVKRVNPPKIPKKESKFYEVDDTMKLIDALNLAPIKYKLMTTLTIFTGIRRSELMGLRWQDIDINNHTITIAQTSQYVRGQGIVIGDTKNNTSQRTISYPEFVSDMFKLLQWQQQEDKNKLEELWTESGMVFIQDNGKAMHPDTITKWFDNFITESKLKTINFHGLRHTHATLLIAQNMDILTISKRLGHSNTSTTLNIYGHMIKNADRIASDKFENLLKKPQENNDLSSKCHHGTKKASE